MPPTLQPRRLSYPSAPRTTRAHRLQGGDPNGDGTGGVSIWGTEFEDEVDRAVRFDRPGVLAMVRSG